MEGVEKYLSRYGDASELPKSGTWSHALCLPACAEDEAFLDTLESIRRADGGADALVIVVVNGAADAVPAVHQENGRLLSLLQQLADPNLLLLDHASQGRRLPAKQGVGLARKIGTDTALALHARGDVASPWLLSTDADVQVPVDYFTALPGPDASVSAALFPFEHSLEGSAAQQEAMRQYECGLHHHVLGLRWAGSPYAFHTIGSTLALHAAHYTAARGFPKRLAGEDFHLLNKMVKLAPVRTVQSRPMRIRGRLSQRTPFGTGQALRGIEEAGGHTVYHPGVYAELKTWLAALDAFAERPDSGALRDGLGPALRDALEALGAFEAAHQACQQVRPGSQLRRRLHEWNDGLRTIRLIHGLRDRGLPSLPLFEALACAGWLPSSVPQRTFDALELLRGETWATVRVPGPTPERTP
jgi:hypothetical protein